MLKGDADPRYFTTQADGTHFSGLARVRLCLGNGLYRGMMDDTINVAMAHCLKVGENGWTTITLVGRFIMHVGRWGIQVGMPGDEVQFITFEYDGTGRKTE